MVRYRRTFSRTAIPLIEFPPFVGCSLLDPKQTAPDQSHASFNPCNAGAIHRRHAGRLSSKSGLDSKLLRVFARKLRGNVRVGARGLFLGLFVHLEAGLARPAALEIVLDAELQAAEPVGFQFDRI